MWKLWDSFTIGLFCLLYLRFVLRVFVEILIKGFAQIRSRTNENSSAFNQFHSRKCFPQFRSGTTEVSFVFDQFQSRKCFPQYCCHAISAAEQRNSIRFQLVPLEKMFPAIPLSRNSATGQRKFSFLMGNTCPFFHCPVFPHFSRTRVSVFAKPCSPLAMRFISFCIDPRPVTLHTVFEKNCFKTASWCRRGAVSCRRAQLSMPSDAETFPVFEKKEFKIRQFKMFKRQLHPRSVTWTRNSDWRN